LKKEIFQWTGLIILLFTAIFMIFKIESSRPQQVYKIDYVDTENQKRTIYADVVSQEDGSITYKEVNSHHYKTIGGHFEVTPYEYMTYEEMKKYDFSK